MELLLDFGPDLSRWLQENLPQLETLMSYITELGSFNFYLLVIPAIYWCFNKQLGATLIYLLSFSNAIGEFLKAGFRDPRPYWYDPTLALSEEPTYGFPSNHSLVPPILFYLVAESIKKRWFWILGGLTVLLIMFSRIYLGVHDLPDVAFGLLFGLLILSGYLIWRKNFLERFNNRILGQKLLAAVLLPLFLTIIAVALFLAIGDPPTDNPDWQHLYAESDRAGLDGATANIASLLGFGIGLLFENTRIRFQVAGSQNKRVARYLVGIFITAVIFFGLRSLFPDTDEAPYIISLPLRALRYFIASIWVSYYAPALFVRLNLAQSQPKPSGITVKGDL